jgi:hypothetical protein
LMAAEALNRKQSPDDATASAYVNNVRSRVGLLSITSTGDPLYAAIKKERRLELADEGQRFFDLVRWNDALSVLGLSGFVAGDEHYPIPKQVDLGSYNPEPTSSLDKDLISNDISLYPVPSDGILYLSNKSGATIDNIEIYDISGKKVFSQNAGNQDKADKMDLRYLGKGIYLMKIVVKNAPVYKKFSVID